MYMKDSHVFDDKEGVRLLVVYAITILTDLNHSNWLITAHSFSNDRASNPYLAKLDVFS